MPVIGEFHGKYWRARANAPPASGTGSAWMYPGYQAVVIGCLYPFAAIAPIWDRLKWYWRLARRLWQWRDRARLETWIARLEQHTREDLDGLELCYARWRAPSSRRRDQLARLLDQYTDEGVAVLERMDAVMRSPRWDDARKLVRECATTPKFHRPEQWVEYSRALKANAGQAQNVFRHIKVVHELKAAHPELSNPDAHLLAELAYQGFAFIGRTDRQVVTR